VTFAEAEAVSGGCGTNPYLQFVFVTHTIRVWGWKKSDLRAVEHRLLK
jgi:hypothetical protein